MTLAKPRVLTLLRRAALLALLALLVPAAALASTIRVHYDTGWGGSIGIRGSKAPLSWTATQPATWTAGNVWTYSWPNASGDMELKPMLNGTTWSRGGNYKVKAGATVDVYPAFRAANGRLVKVTGFYSPQLGNSRTLIVYLPPSYTESTLRRYPVIYAHDGQNLFDAATAFGGVEWRIDETANSLMGSGLMDEAIVVGIYNAGASRIYEYTPCCDPYYGGGGADLYERFVIDSVKPWVDGHYRTLTRKEDTAMMGSSLGGLVSFYIGRRNPAVFSRTASLSSSFWWNSQALTITVEQSTAHPAVRFYVDAGTNNDGLAETTRMKNALTADGYVQGGDLYYYVANGGSHNEASWAARVHVPLQYLFPWQSTVY